MRRAERLPVGMELQLILSDGSTYPSLENGFSPAASGCHTGTLQIAACSQPDYILRPGQYGMVRAKIETRHGAILIRNGGQRIARLLSSGRGGRAKQGARQNGASGNKLATTG